MAQITINPMDGVSTIRPAVYGHFAEHLGRCIYDGIWVGEESPIPNTAGFRNDVIAALQKMKPPVIRWPGGCFADDYHWQDGIGPAPKPPAADQHPLGRSDRDQPGGHAGIRASSAAWWERNLISAAMWARERCASCAIGWNTAISPAIHPGPRSARRTAAQSRST